MNQINNQNQNQKKIYYSKVLDYSYNENLTSSQLKSNRIRISAENVSFDINNNIQKENSGNNSGKLFLLKVEEAKFDEFKVGYIFILRPYEQKNKSENKTNMQENKNIDVLDASNVSFGEDKIKYNCSQTITGPFNLNNQNNDKFEKNFLPENEYQFTFDVEDMTYKQFKYNEEKISFYNILKERAIEKIAEAKKQNREYESEEEESSEYENTGDEEDENSNSNSSNEISKEKNEELILKNTKKNSIEEKKENSNNNNKDINPLNKLLSKKTLIKAPTINIVKNQNEINKKKEEKEEDFYHVNFDKVALYIYNYSLGYVELQKGHSHKISQVTSVINTEKEKMKNSNTKYTVNPKIIKGKKKLNIKKEGENELNVHSDESIKLKEIYGKLSSNHKETVITKLIFVSIFIFILIIGTGLVNILIYYKIKNNIYTFFLLIKKSDNLYQNLLFEITLVKEILILYNPFYTNPMNQNKTYIYQLLSGMLYDYYVDNTNINSDITAYFDVLSKEEQESIEKISVDLYIIDPVQTSESHYYQYKTYNLLSYSAYRELNSALYHITKLKPNEIHHYDDNVFYFLKNGMSNLLIKSEEQMWTLTEKFHENVKNGHKLLIICCFAMFIVYCLCAFIFIIFYKKVNIKKYKYLSLLNELDTDLIISSLNKCEKFSQKLHEKNDSKETKNQDNILFDSDSGNFSENEIDTNSPDKKNSNAKVLKSKNDNNEKNKPVNKFYVNQLILFLIIFIFQLAIYIYYYLRMTNYQRIVTYEYYISMYASNFLYIFIGLREYIFDRKALFYNQSVDTFLEENLNNYYVIFADKSKKKDTYRVYFPDFYQKFLNYLYNGKICEFINKYNLENPSNKQYACNEFFYSSSGFGFFTLIATFVEEIRIIKDKMDTNYNIAQKKNFVYNETYFNSPNGFYEELYEKYNKTNEYIKYNPANALRFDSHKELFITYNYINMQVYSFLISESLRQFQQVFSKYNKINLIINIIFIILVSFGFCFIWIPFIYKQDKNLRKIKNMLSIVPSELLTNLNNINNLLEIDESSA